MVSRSKGEVEGTFNQADIAHVEIPTYTSVGVTQGGESDRPKCYPAHPAPQNLVSKEASQCQDLNLLDAQGVPVGASTQAKGDGDTNEKAADVKRKIHPGREGSEGFVECPVMMIPDASVNFPYAPKSFNELLSGRGDDMMHGMHTCFGDNLRKFPKMKQTMGKLWSELHVVGQSVEKSFLIVANGFIDEQPFQEWVSSRYVCNTNTFLCVLPEYSSVVGQVIV